ncbi:MAG: hypothetical protein J5806_03415 [Lentisphaeria bacterium]|nr:hypothetical protein [Lentisphaeria bacterium]
MDEITEKPLRHRGKRLRRVLLLLVCFPLLLFILYGCRSIFIKAPKPLEVKETETVLRPLTADEQAALRWLDHVLGPLSEAEERKWWDHGKLQFGLSATRYHIAFAGYAAAALGIRGNAEQKAVAGRILKNCIERYLRREVWAYTQAKSYWGTKEWAPDPCYRENVMYTGHLLQLLALYECFTGDKKYWTEGFDFVWNAKKRVHYDVRKLIDVTVEQMRAGNGGVTCEPGLLFFPCNNHPHFALKLFARLGHGDWSAESRRWEHWALDHYFQPLLGGGTLNLLCHTKTGIFYPRGYTGLDAWSILWYEPWAENRGTALALWEKAKEWPDWEKLSAPADAVTGADSCMDPQQVPDTVLAVFLAAAARVCDDPASAERLERPLDAKYLRRENGFYWLEVKREWRIGATAMRILALAEANGSRFREWSDHLTPAGPSAGPHRTE